MRDKNRVGQKREAKKKSNKDCSSKNIAASGSLSLIDDMGNSDDEHARQFLGL